MKTNTWRRGIGGTRTPALHFAGDCSAKAMLLLMFSLGFSAVAEEQFTCDWERYPGAVAITGSTGPGGAVTIPRNIYGFPVVAIEGTIQVVYPGPGPGPALTYTNYIGAFYGQWNITSISIPPTVTNICAYANVSGYVLILQPFGGCTNLSTITVDDLNPRYSSVDGVLFDKNRTTLIRCPPGKAGSYTIPPGVANIDEGAFSQCRNLVEVTVPDTVSHIGNSAFSSCARLTNIIVPSGVTSIGMSAFSGCTSLANIILPESVTSIGYGAFQRCTNLTSMAIPNSVTSIEPSTFAGCANLASITIPNNVTNIGSYAFSGCTSLISVAIPHSVTNIGDSAFASCVSLTNVTIPNSVTSIGQNAFASCSGLTSVTIPGSVISIGNNALPWFGETAFHACSNLTTIAVDAANLNYSSVDGVLFNKDHTSLLEYPAGRTGPYTIPDGVTEVGPSAFSDCTRLSGIVIPSSVTIISSSAFYGCSGLTSVTIPNSVTSIGGGAFSYCRSLTNVTIGDGVTRLVGVFAWCTGLKSVTIPDSVTDLGDQTFYGCYYLTNVIIGRGVTRIGEWVFGDCGSLKGIYFWGKPPSIVSFSGGAANNIIVYYLPGTVGWGATYAYRPTAHWVLPHPVIVDSGFYGIVFGFTLSWATNVPVVVEASTSPVGSAWLPVSTNTLVNGSSYFPDIEWMWHSSRFYRLRAP